MSLTIGNVNGGSLSAEFVESLARTVRHFPSLAYSYASSPYLPQNRNVVVEAFLAHAGSDWLLFIDSDMRWDPEQIDQLLEDAPADAATSALYFHPLGAHGNASPVAWRADREPVQWGAGGVQEAAYVGAGFLLLPRRVIADVAAAYEGRPFECSELGQEFVGEDLVFCRRLAALGYRVLVNCDVVAEHVKPVGLVPRDVIVDEVVRLSEAVDV